MKKTTKKITKLVMVAILKFMLFVAAVGLFLGTALWVWGWATRLAPAFAGFAFVGLLIWLAYRWSVDEERDSREPS